MGQLDLGAGSRASRTQTSRIRVSPGGGCAGQREGLRLSPAGHPASSCSERVVDVLLVAEQASGQCHVDHDDGLPQVTRSARLVEGRAQGNRARNPVASDDFVGLQALAPHTDKLALSQAVRWRNDESNRPMRAPVWLEPVEEPTTSEPQRCPPRDRTAGGKPLCALEDALLHHRPVDSCRNVETGRRYAANEVHRLPFRRPR